jgi:ABC-type phosphate/phosphonate transport system substrate-binding protein
MLNVARNTHGTQKLGFDFAQPTQVGWVEALRNPTLDFAAVSTVGWVEALRNPTLDFAAVSTVSQHT